MAYKGKIAKGTSSLYKKEGYGKNAVFMKTGDKQTSLEKKYMNNPDYPKGNAYLNYWENARDNMVKDIEAGNRATTTGPMSYEAWFAKQKNL